MRFKLSVWLKQNFGLQLPYSIHERADKAGRVPEDDQI